MKMVNLIHCSVPKVFALILILSIGLESAVIAQENEYKLKAGDSISVTVFGEPELSITRAKVPSDGVIVFPLLGGVDVRGQTIRGLNEQLTEKYRDGYLKQPKLAVTIVAYRSYYMNGEVRNPGAYEYVEGLTIRKAIFLAGGLSERGTERKLEILTDGNNEPVPVDDLDAPLHAGDIIIVGASLF